MKQNSLLGWALTAVMIVFWAWIFGMLLSLALNLKDSFPMLAGLAGLVIVGLACWLVNLSLK